MNFDLPNELLIQSIEHSNLAHTISRIDGDMKLTYVDQAFLNDTGYDREDVIGRNYRKPCFKKEHTHALPFNTMALEWMQKQWPLPLILSFLHNHRRKARA